jgi:hypothetical protein
MLVSKTERAAGLSRREEASPDFQRTADLPMYMNVLSADEDERFSQRELVSPELALVDPELARRERARLPHPGEQEALARISAQLDRTPVRPEGDALAPVVVDLLRGRGRWAAPVAVATALVIVALLADVRVELGKTPAAADPAAVDDQPAAEAPPATGPTPPVSPPSSPPAPSSPGTKPTRNPAPGPRPPATRTARPQARSFAWAPASGASAYQVEFFRGDVRIFAAKTRRPAITVPSTWRFGGRRWRLEPGEYRWYVWRVVERRRDDRAIVQARLTVRSPA